jgi:uncharacterized protein
MGKFKCPSIGFHRLSAKALRGVIEEFISRAGTDYGETDVPMEIKFRHVKYKLENGLAVLIFDDESETTNVFLADEPILNKIDATNLIHKDDNS